MKQNKSTAKGSGGAAGIIKKQSFQYGTTTIILVAIILVLVIALNVFSGLLSDRFPLNIDLTRNKIYTMSTAARNYAESIKDDIQIYILNNERDFAKVYAQPLAILNSFVQTNGHLKLEYIDPQVNNTFANNYPNEELKEDYIIVQKGNRYKVINDDTLINYTAADQSNTGFEVMTSQIEDRIISAIYFVQDTTTYTVGFTTGHNEGLSNVLRENIAENNFKVKDVSLDQANWSNGINILIIYAPLNDFSVDNVKQLDSFMNNNGKQDRYIAYFAAPDQPSLPNLEEFLKDWGIEVTDNIILEKDTSRMKQGENTFVFAEISSTQDDYGTDYINMKAGYEYQLLLPYCRELKAVYDSRDGISTHQVALANGDARIVPMDNVIAEGISGEFAGIMSAERVVNDSVSRLLVVGSSAMVTDNVLNLGNTTINQKFILKALNSWTDKVASEVVVQPVDISNVGIQLTTKTANLWLTIFMIVIPAGILIAGMLVFIKRRYQ